LEAVKPGGVLDAKLGSQENASTDTKIKAIIVFFMILNLPLYRLRDNTMIKIFTCLYTHIFNVYLCLFKIGNAGFKYFLIFKPRHIFIKV
jgi:hypothetical protein